MAWELEKLENKSLLGLASDWGDLGEPGNKYLAEFTRRQTRAQIRAAEAQVRSAQLQLLAVIAMFLTAVATAALPWISRALAG
jgi:hypothetical protein